MIRKTKMGNKKKVSYCQGGLYCSSLPAGLGGNGEFERKFERKIQGVPKKITLLKFSLGPVRTTHWDHLASL